MTIVGQLIEHSTKSRTVIHLMGTDFVRVIFSEAKLPIMRLS